MRSNPNGKFSHAQQWRFGVFWQDSSGVGGSGGSSATDSSASGTGTDAAPSGGATGFSVTAAPAANAAANAAAAFGGGPSGIGFGGQTSTGGFGGGQTAAVGGPTGGGAGTAAGGSAPGPAGSGAGGVPGGSLAGPGGINLANAIATLTSYGDVSVPPGYATGVPTATSPVTVLGLGPSTGYAPSLVTGLNSQLSGLGATASAPSLSQLIAQLMGNTLGGAAPGGLASLGAGGGATMGYPSVEGVSPGVTAAPAGPAPSYATNSFQALNPAFYSNPSQLAALAQQANTQPAATQAVNTTQAPSQPQNTNALMAFLNMLMGNQSLPGIAGNYIG